MNYNFAAQIEELELPSYVKSKEDCCPNMTNWLWETLQLCTRCYHPAALIEIIEELSGYNDREKNIEVLEKFYELEKQVYMREPGQPNS